MVGESFEERYVLESDGDWEIGISVFHDDCNNTMIEMWDSYSPSATIIGGLDNDAIDAIIVMLEKARVAINS